MAEQNETQTETFTCQSNLTLTSQAGRGGDTRVEYTVYLPVAINFLTLLISITVLLCLTRWRRAKHVFLPKTAEKLGREHKMAPWDWFREAYQVDMEEAISIDGRIVVRLCLLGIKFSASGVIGLCVLMPIYSNAGGLAQGAARYSVSNLSDAADSTVWILVVAAFYFTATFIWLLRAEWRYFVKMRQRHFCRLARGDFGTAAQQASCSLMLENVPASCENAAAVRQHFAKLWVDDGIFACCLQRDTAMLYHLKSLKARSKQVTGWCTCCQQGIDRQLERAVKIQTELFQKARQTTDALQGLALDGALEVQDVARLFASPQLSCTGDEDASQEPGAQLRPTSTAFVTLKRVSDRVVSQQALLFSLASQEHARDWVVKAAPEARDIIWTNVCVPFTQVTRFSRIGSLACFVGILVWSVPVTGIMTMASAENLHNWFPHQVEWLEDHYPAVYGLGTQYLPVLALMALIVLLPYFLRFLSERFEMRKTKTDVATSVLWRNFCFQFFTLWLTVFSSSLMDSFRQILKEPTCISNILGTSIPKVSFYFLSFVIARIGTSLPLLLLRPAGLIPLIFRQKPGPAYCQFEVEATNIAIIFVLGCMYCVVAPFMMLACLVYFSMAFLTYKWLFVHVYETEFDMAGEMWYSIFDGLVGGMMFGILSVCGLASLYGGTNVYGVYAMWLLPIFIGIFRQDCVHKFGAMSRVMPFEDAVEIDRSGGIDLSNFHHQYLLDPILKVDEQQESDEESPRQLTPTASTADSSSEEESSNEGGVPREDECIDVDAASAYAWQHPTSHSERQVSAGERSPGGSGTTGGAGQVPGCRSQRV